ncbi:MAG TPA: DUF6702 family protein [Gemmatimonadales bacterium]
MVTRLAALVAPALLAVHPIHTAVAELLDDPATRTVLVTIRAFADDLGAAVVPGDTAAMLAYVLPRVTLVGAGGRAIALRPAGLVRAGDIVRIQLRGAAPEGLAGARVRMPLLTERFEDQVNIVRAAYGGHTASLLFTRGDQAKALP